MQRIARFSASLRRKGRKSFLIGTADRVPNLVLRGGGVVCAGGVKGQCGGEA